MWQKRDWGRNTSIAVGSCVMAGKTPFCSGPQFPQFSSNGEEHAYFSRLL